jgi:hypothetical protein
MLQAQLLRFRTLLLTSRANDQSTPDIQAHGRPRQSFLRLIEVPQIRRLLILLGRHQVRWSRLSEQIFRVDKWSLCRG